MVEPVRIRIRCKEDTYDRWKKLAKRHGVSYKELAKVLMNIAEMEKNDILKAVDDLRKRKHTRRREKRR